MSLALSGGQQNYLAEKTCRTPFLPDDFTAEDIGGPGDNQIKFPLTLPSPPKRDCAVMGKAPSFPRNLSLQVLSRERESRSLKLSISIIDWMPASAGMTNYETASFGGESGWDYFPGNFS